MRLGAAKYLLPFFFVLNPALILHGHVMEVLFAVTTCTIGIALIGSAMEGYLLWVGNLPQWTRPFLFITGLLLGYPDWVSDIAGLILSGIVIIVALPGIRKQNAEPAAIT